MKRETLMVSLVVLSGALLAAADDARRAELAARVADDVNVPVRAGGVDGRPFWNVRSIIFMHPPAFDFASVKGAVHYRFTVTDDCLLTHDFTADRPTADLSPVWKDVPVGFANVRVEGVDADGKAIGVAGERRFWRSAPYEPGTYPDRPWGYDECARRYLNTLFDHPNTRHFRETGAPDGVTDLLNIYPSKMNSALIRGLLRLAGLDRRRRDAAIATAKRVGEYMLSISQPASAPLAHFPPTYWPMKGQRTNMASIEYAGQVMLVYPAQVGQAYLALHKATGESRWLEAATGIAKTYERLQLPNGTWYLKMWEKDGKPVIGGNGKKPVELIPLGVCMFAEALAERTGDAHWRKLADRAFASIDEGALKTYAFAPQFEDTPPTANYRDLTSSLPLEIAHYLLRRFPADPARRAQVRELLRWVEDQFIVWRRPFRADGRGILSEPWHGFNPCWGAVCTPASCGQRCECYPVDVWFEAAGVLEKYRWTVRENSLTALAASVFHRLGQLEQDELLLAKARTLGDSVVRVQQMGGDGEIATEWFSHNLTGVSCPRNWTNCGVGAALHLLELADDSQAARVADLVSRMTLEEKVAQLSQMQLMTTSAKAQKWTEAQNEERRKAIREGLGSLIFFDPDAKGRNAWQRIAVEESRLGIPLIFGMDIIHGDALVFPISLGLACSFEPELFEKAQAVAAREAASSGIDWTFAPMCDLSRDPRWGRVSETCGEDPYLVSCCCAAQVRGFQGRDPSAPDRVAACLKHFVGYSAVTGGRDYNDSEITRWTLWNMHLPSFRASVAAGALTVMSSFNTIDGIPAVANRFALTDALRGVLGFDGFVVSDWGSVGELLQWRCAADKADAARLALNAGNDMDMMSGCYREGLAEDVRRGTVSVATVDEAVRRILDVKMRLGLFERPYVDEAAQDKVRADVDRNERDLARTCAERSMVLLKNDGVLPLNAGRLGSVALIGPVAEDRLELNGNWSFRGKPLRMTVAEALKAALPGVKVEVVKGCSVITETPTKIGQDGVVIADRDAHPADASLDIDGAVRAARGADVVILALAEAREWTGENASRASLGLSGRQQELFDAVAAVGKPVVSVVFSGRPLVLPEIWEKSSAVFYAWQPGSEGPRALADLLTGVSSPSGRLSISVPHDVSQVPAFYNRPSTGRPGSGQYRDTKERGARYPFGFGLTYTSFEYGPVIACDGVARCSVRNVGRRPGTEVVQLYVCQQACSTGWRPVCELRGFERATLAPGESRDVSFALKPETLGYVRSDGSPAFDSGRYRIWIAPNSRDLGEGVVTEVGSGKR